MSNGKVAAIVGDLGAGKTTFIKKFTANAKRKQAMCYLRIETDFKDMDAETYTSFTAFLQKAVTVNNTLCIIDEAYTCLPSKLTIKLGKPEDLNNVLADFLVNTRKMNVFLFIIFHSLSQVPLWLVPYLDYFIRFSTNDMLQYQAQRFISFPHISSNLMQQPVVEKYKPVILKLR